MKYWFGFFIIALAAFIFFWCKQRDVDVVNGAATIPTATPSPTQQVFQVKGTIIELLPAEKSVRIKHEADDSTCMGLNFFNHDAENRFRTLRDGVTSFGLQ